MTGDDRLLGPHTRALSERPWQPVLQEPHDRETDADDIPRDVRRPPVAPSVNEAPSPKLRRE